MKYDASKLKKLTDESKDVWDYIRRKSTPIEKYKHDVSYVIEISPNYMFGVLEKALDDGIISTKTPHWRDLYEVRNHFPIYLCESWLVRILYGMDVPIYYRCGKGNDNSNWYRFYAKITYRDRVELRRFIDEETDKYIRGKE